MKKLPLILSLLSLNLVLFGTVSCGDILPDEDEKPIVNKPILKVEETLHGSISLSVENNYCDIDDLEIGVTILVGVTPETGYVLDTLTVNNEDIKDSRKFVISEKIEYDVVATFKTSETTNEFASLEIKTPQNPVNPKIFTYIQTANVCFLNSTGLILLSPVLIRTLL